MSYNKNKLAEYLKGLFEETTDAIDAFDPKQDHEIIGGAGSRIELKTENGKALTFDLPEDGPPTLVIKSNGIKAKRSFITECLKDREMARRIGEMAINKQLNSVLQSHFDCQQSDIDWGDLVKSQVLQALKSTVKAWRVVVPINNLILHEAITIGTVELVRHEVGIVTNTLTVTNHRGPTDKTQDTIQKAGSLRVLNEIAQQGTAWAITTIQAHETRIRDIARDQVETAISVVRAFANMLYPPSMRAAFGLPDETASGMSGFVGESDGNISIQFDRRGYFIPFELNSGILHQLRSKFYFEELGRISGIEWEALNTLEQAIRVASLWLGRSVIASTTAEALTHCVIALERLLIMDKEQTTTERFADRLAFLISTEAESRKAIHKAAKRLYDLRSLVVHAGYDSVEFSQHREIEWLAVNGLINVVAASQKYKDHQSFCNHLHDLKME